MPLLMPSIGVKHIEIMNNVEKFREIARELGDLYEEKNREWNEHFKRLN